MKINNANHLLMTKEPNGNTSILFTSVHFERWCKLGLIPKRLADHFFKSRNQIKLRMGKMQLLQKENPNLPIKDFFGESHLLTVEETKNCLEDIKTQVELHEFLVEKWTILVKALSHLENNLFLQVDPSKNFGIARAETDCIYHLQELLDNMKAEQNEETNYTARGDVKFTNGRCVALEYDFLAKNRAEADLIVKEFKKMMGGKGLKVWLAFWKKANVLGKARFECRISDVMDLLSAKDRKSHFNDEERSEFWTITRLLSSTKFRLEWPVKNKKTSTSPTRWVQQPLLRIFSGEKEMDEKCPIRIGVEVLTEEVAAERFAPAFLSNGTLRLLPSEVGYSQNIRGSIL